MVVEDEKKILNALLDDDESFIVKKRRREEKGERIDDIVKQVRESIKRRAMEDEGEERRVQIERLERIRANIERSVEVPRLEEKKREEKPFISDVEINVLKAIATYGANLKLVARKTGYPEIVVSKAVEKLMEKGYIDENLNVTERGLPIVGVPESEEKSIAVRIIDVAIIVTGIVLVLSTLHYFGYI